MNNFPIQKNVWEKIVLRKKFNFSELEFRRVTFFCLLIIFLAAYFFILACIDFRWRELHSQMLQHLFDCDCPLLWRIITLHPFDKLFGIRN